MTLEQSSDNRLRVLAISGSLRTASFNTGLLRTSREVAPDGMDVEIFDIRGLPFYDGDLEAQGNPEPVSALKSAIRESDGVIFATPEYNWGTSGVLKNAIDWASRDREEGSLMGKPGTIIGAGGRSGTARAQMQLLETLGETSTIVMVKPGVLIAAFAPDTFDSEGNLISPDMRQLLGRQMEEFAQWIMRVGPLDFVPFACEIDVALAAR